MALIPCFQMENALEKLSHCIEFDKINMASPYPAEMKGREGADYHSPDPQGTVEFLNTLQV